MCVKGMYMYVSLKVLDLVIGQNSKTLILGD